MEPGDDLYPSLKVFSKSGSLIDSKSIAYADCAAGGCDVERCASVIKIIDKSTIEQSMLMTGTKCDSLGNKIAGETFKVEKNKRITVSSTGNIEFGVEKLINNSASREREKGAIETVLNMPDLIKFSKMAFVRERHKTVYLFIKPDPLTHSNALILQNDIPLSIVHSIDSLNTEETPCYVVKELSISGDEADILVLFDYTGAMAYGKLLYMKNKWVPDPEFIVGVR
ncbi:MAG TPA: hypothetical protein VIU12_08040 [Chryseolinea sp.]